MFHKLALVIGGIAAVAVLAVAMAAAGFSPNGPAARAADPTTDPTAGATPSATTVTDTVYVAPVPTQRVIHVSKPAPAGARRALPPIVVVRKTSHGGGDDNGGD